MSNNDVILFSDVIATVRHDLVSHHASPDLINLFDARISTFLDIVPSVPPGNHPVWASYAPIPESNNPGHIV